MAKPWRLGLSLLAAGVLTGLEKFTPDLSEWLHLDIPAERLQMWIAHYYVFMFSLAMGLYWELFAAVREEVSSELKSGRSEAIALITKGNADLLAEMHAILDKLVVAARVLEIPRSARYGTLRDLADKFERTASNCWFNTRPPTDERDVNKETYFARLLDRAKTKDDVELRRLVLATKKNLPWIEKLVIDYSGLSHVSVGVYTHANAPLLSVQIFDHKRALLINPKDTGDVHDLVIEDRCTVEIMQHYYQALWEKSDVVLDRGTACAGPLQKLKKQYATE